MSHRRLTLALAAGAVLSALAAGPVAAGGFATTEVTSGLDEPPVAGEDREVRVLLLQHGVTPVDYGQVLVTAVPAGAGDAVTAEAMALGDGAWAATLVFPTAGEWQVRVTHNDLETPGPVAITVADAGQAVPLIAASIGGLAALAMALIAVVLLVRRPKPEATGTAGEPALHRG